MYQSIVVGATGSPSAARAVESAAALAERFSATLHLVGIVKTPGLAAAPQDAVVTVATAQWSGEACAQVEEGLRQLATALSERGINARPHVYVGDPASILCEVAAREGAGLIVVGNRGMKGAGRMLGSVPNTVSHRAACDVMIVRTT